MLRAPLVLTATIAGVAAVISYQPSLPSAGGAPQRPGMTRGSAAGVVTVTGPDVPNQFGHVQVRLRIAGGRIVAADAVALPGSDRRSQEISAAAAPVLDREVLTAQNAQIDGVSGASYTSDSYRRSVQAALDGLPGRSAPAPA